MNKEIKLLSDNLYNWSDTNLEGDITRNDCDKIIQWMLGKSPQNYKNNANMTIEQFDETKFSGLMKVKHNGIVRDLCSVDFEEKLIAFNVDNDEDLHWARCENCELIKN